MTPEQVFEQRVAEEVAKRLSAEQLPAKQDALKAEQDQSLRRLAGAAVQEARAEAAFRNGDFERSNSYEQLPTTRGAALLIAEEIEAEVNG